MTETTVLLVDDHQVFRMGLSLLIAAEADMRIVGEAGSGQEAVDLVRDLQPDIVAMDITMAGMDGVEATGQIKSVFPQTKIVTLSIHDGKDYVEKMLQAGATGYVLKERAPEDLVPAMRAVLRDEVFLSPSIEDFVVSQYMAGLTNKESDSAAAELNPLLTTKLYRPQLARDLIVREPLLDRLDWRRQRPLTLVSAPAGYGKTTLVSSWLESIDDPHVWFQIDEDDNELNRFVTYFIAALQTVFPDIGQQTERLLKAPVLPSLSALAASLVSELDQVPVPFIIVLDDYHLINETQIHNLLDELLRHPLPSLHLVISTRQDPALPLSRWRAKGKLTEVRQQDLRFSADETADFLRQQVDFTVDEATAKQVAEKTDGWVTGLRLLALSLRHHRNPLTVLASLPEHFYLITEYLLGEVLNTQPGSVREFLLQTSILDRFSAPLCAAVCRPVDEELLAQLYQQNLFLISLDYQGQWFRFHHLFRELLQQQLHSQFDEQRIAALHTRASHWFAEQGLIDEALKHALAADDVAYAVQLVEKHRNRLMNTEQWNRLDKWLQKLPPTTLETNPKLLITQAWSGMIFHSQYDKWLNTPDQVAELLLASSLAPDENRMIEAEANALRTTLLYSTGEVARAIDSAEHVLKNLHPESNSMRGQTATILVMAQQGTGHFDRARKVIQTTIGNDSFSNPIINTKMLTGLCAIHWLEGNISEIKQPALQLLRVGEEYNLPESLSLGRYFMGCFHYLRNELAEAESHFKVVVENRYLAREHYHAQCVFGLALCEIAQDRSDQAWQVVDSLMEYLSETGNTWLFEVAQAFQAELALRLNQIVEPYTWKKFADLNLFTPMYVFYVPRLTAIRAMLALHTPEGQKDAADLLDRLYDIVVSTHNRRVLIDVLALQALLHADQGERPAALEKLRESLALAEPGGFIRNFVDMGPQMNHLLTQLRDQGVACAYIDQILAAFPDAQKEPTDTAEKPASQTLHPSTPTPQLRASSLTRRELEVLRLLATYLTTAEIAVELTLSVATVRTHIKRIYSKLDAHSRKEAVTTAQELGFL